MSAVVPEQRQTEYNKKSRIGKREGLFIRATPTGGWFGHVTVIQMQNFTQPCTYARIIRSGIKVFYQRNTSSLTLFVHWQELIDQLAEERMQFSRPVTPETTGHGISYRQSLTTWNHDINRLSDSH